MANKQRPPLPGARPLQSTNSQLKRINCQRRSPNASPLLSQGHQPSRPLSVSNEKRILPSTITTIPTTTNIASPMKQPARRKFTHFCFHRSKNHPQYQHSFFPNHRNNYYTSKMNRSITNCEKFLPDHDLSSSVREKDLLLIHAKQGTRFV